MSDKAELFIDCKCFLGEGPFWHPERKELFWFDINVGHLYRANSAGEILGRIEFGEPASAAALIDRNEILVATATGILKLDIESAAKKKIADLEADNPHTRSNDARVSPSGDWWIGTMRNGSSDEHGALYRYREGQFTKLIDPVDIPNATCFSPDGSIAYFADTMTRKILKVALDKDTGLPAGDWEVFVDNTGATGAPDGAVVDSEGYLWNAEFNGGRVVRYSPDGEVDRVIELPCPRVTCPAFGGDDLKTLYITTAREGASPEELEKYPLAGSMFSIEVDVAGLPETPVRV